MTAGASVLHHCEVRLGNSDHGTAHTYTALPGMIYMYMAGASVLHHRDVENVYDCRAYTYMTVYVDICRR